MTREAVHTTDRALLLKHMGPCSLLCYTCSGYKDGAIRSLSEDLLRYTDGIYEFHARHSASDDSEPFRQFRAFRDVLGRQCQAPCEGCRDGAHHGCSIEGCFIDECARSHDVDFCGECTSFPCEKTKGLFGKEAYTEWLSGNTSIREIGAEKYYENRKMLSHYAAYLAD